MYIMQGHIYYQGQQFKVQSLGVQGLDPGDCQRPPRPHRAGLGGRRDALAKPVVDKPWKDLQCIMMHLYVCQICMCVCICTYLCVCIQVSVSLCV